MAAVSPAGLDTGKGRDGMEACFRPRAAGRRVAVGMLTAVAPEALAELTGNRGGTPAITQASSVAASGATPERAWKRGRIAGRTFVDDGETRLDHRAMPGIDRAGDRGREDDRPTLLKRDESVGPGGIVRRETRAGDGDETPAIGKARQRRADMTKRGVRHAAIDMREAEKGGFIRTTLGRMSASR